METHNNIPDFLMAYFYDKADEEQKQLAIEWLKIPETMMYFSN
jgi:hypothetical protein